MGRVMSVASITSSAGRVLGVMRAWDCTAQHCHLVYLGLTHAEHPPGRGRYGGNGHDAPHRVL